MTPTPPDAGSADPADASDNSPAPAKTSSSGRYAQLIAAGILLSRIAGLIRESIFANYFGNSTYASAFKVALRMPNVLQNLLGEGTLSASFIPVYARLLEQGETEKAGRLAGAIFALLLAVAGVLALFGVVMAPVLVSVFFTGATGELRDITVTLTRIIFPMTGILVLSAWALGILNSHRKFFVSYFAPVMWNAAMIGALLIFGSRMSGDAAGQRSLAIVLAWAAVVGGGLQFLVQLPWVLSLEKSLKFGFDRKSEGVRAVIANAGPAVMGRGVVQLSGWADLFLASWLYAGAAAALSYAQTIYILPYSLFGMSVAAAELPEMARGGRGQAEVLRLRVNAGLRRILLFVLPSAIGFLTMGDVIVAALFQRGEFSRIDTIWVSLVLAGYSIGLIASTSTRMYVSAFYAENDTKTPAKIALLRVALAAALGAALMVYLEHIEIGEGFDTRPLGAAGLALGTGIAAWVEWFYLRRYLRRMIGDVGAGVSTVLRLGAAALAGAVAGRGVLLLLPPFDFRFGLVAEAVVGVGIFGVVYFGVARLLGVPEAAAMVKRVIRR